MILTEIKKEGVLLRKIFLENLPRKAYGKKMRINWSESANQKLKVKFIYENIIGEVEIVDYEKKNQKVTLL